MRRAPSPPRAPLEDRLFDERRDALGRLAGFVSDHGRLPSDAEFGEDGGMRGAFGNAARAERLLARLLDPAARAIVAAMRSDDLLVFAALSRFGGRPAFNALPESLRLDVKAFFGTYAALVSAADRLLTGLGDRAALEEAFRSSAVGKLMPRSLHVHVRSLAALPLPLRLYEGCAERLLGRVDEADVVKLDRWDRKVSYLSYPDFETDAHPVLAASVSVDLQTFATRTRRWDGPNPPLLHRKEEMVDPSFPRRDVFTRLTRAEEAAGLYADPSRIGTRDGWEAALRANGRVLRGHRLLRAGPS